MAAHLKMYSIYKSPKDYPGLYVVREWIIAGPVPRAGEVKAVTKYLDIARASIPPECACILPSPGDDPVILESWI